MKIKLHRKFIKNLRLVNDDIQNAFRTRLEVFIKNPHDACLKNHSLQGRWRGYRSINITGDFRAVYREIDGDKIVFSALGTHSQLYN